MLDYLAETPPVARQAFKATLGTALISGLPTASAGGAADIAVSVDTTAVAADVAALVADGASPTQGHVNTLATDWATLLAAVTAQQATVTGDILVSIDTSVLNTGNKIKAAIHAVLQAIRNAGMLP